MQDSANSAMLHPYARKVREQREPQIPVWLSLVKSVNNARAKLQGDDLELFERLISNQKTDGEVEELIQRWRDGRLRNFGRY